MSGKFAGFTPQAVEFLKNIKENNNKAWFEAHKSAYQKTLLEPLRDLAEDLSGDMLAIDSFLVVGSKAVSRIYRDTRFARNKEPYKTSMWLTFKRPLSGMDGCTRLLLRDRRGRLPLRDGLLQRRPGDHARLARSDRRKTAGIPKGGGVLFVAG